MFRLAVFDLDGTLVNSIEDIAEAINVNLKKWGYPVHSIEKFNYFVGDGVLELCYRALPQDAKERKYELKDAFGEYYSEHFADKTKAYDGIKECMSLLKENSVTLAVASNKTHIFTVEVINKIFGENVFDIVLGNSENRNQKPAPDIIFEILDKTGIDKSQAVMIGDTNIDINTGINAGIKTIGCLWGFRTETELIKAGADFIAAKPEDIVKFII